MKFKDSISLVCRRVVFLGALAVALKSTSVFARDGIPEEYADLYASQADLQWFEDAKFGVFVHWNPSSLSGVEISWGRTGEREVLGQIEQSSVSAEIYDNLYKQFNPNEFDAREWVRMIKSAGARYLIFTTKHHDGFCMFDAPNTDYKITNTPFGRDICKELAEACQKQGVKLFWYYSQPDWMHEDYGAKRHERYREYMYEHLRVLLSDYGKIDGVWFDALGSSWADWDTPRMVKMMRELQPGLLINERWGWGGPVGDYNGDFNTVEQSIGVFKVDRPWETCATMSAGWSWGGGNLVKSKDACLRMLIQAAGGGGNLALNTGPLPNGSINPEEVEVYLHIGAWLRTYGESIYGTKAGPYKPGCWGVSTYKGNKVYLNVTAEFASGVDYEIELPALGVPVKSFKSMNPDIKVKGEINDGTMSICFEGPVMPGRNVVVLELDGMASSIDPIDTMVDQVLLAGATGAASSSYDDERDASVIFSEGREYFESGMHHKAYWSPSPEDSQAWLEASFKKPVTFDTVALGERIHNMSTRSYELLYEKEGEWIPLYEGSEIGTMTYIMCPDITTTKVRILFKEMDDGVAPNLTNLDFY